MIHHWSPETGIQLKLAYLHAKLIEWKWFGGGMQEREDVEAQLKVVEEKLTQALTGQAALQADLDQTRSQAGDTIRTLDSERQQLNTAVRRYLLSCVGFISILWGVFS